MNPNQMILRLKRNAILFKELLTGISEEAYRYKSSPDKWSLLEIICHLHDEEREDFRVRTEHVLEGRKDPMPAIDPPQWVIDRKYEEQDFDDVLKKFLKERDRSIQWLTSLTYPHWNREYEHPQLGIMTARTFLANWVAHDYLHIKQIVKGKYDFLANQSAENIQYAGVWK